MMHRVNSLLVGDTLVTLMAMLKRFSRFKIFHARVCDMFCEVKMSPTNIFYVVDNLLLRLDEGQTSHQ